MAISWDVASADYMSTVSQLSFFPEPKKKFSHIRNIGKCVLPIKQSTYSQFSILHNDQSMQQSGKTAEIILPSEWN